MVKYSNIIKKPRIKRPMPRRFKYGYGALFLKIGGMALRKQLNWIVPVR
jgi:hypothetical protein